MPLYWDYVAAAAALAAAVAPVGHFHSWTFEKANEAAIFMFPALIRAEDAP